MTLSLIGTPTLPAQETSTSENAAPHVTQSTELKSSMDKLEAELGAKYGEAQRARLRRAMSQVSDLAGSKNVSQSTAR